MLAGIISKRPSAADIMVTIGDVIVYPTPLYPLAWVMMSYLAFMYESGWSAILIAGMVISAQIILYVYDTTMHDLLDALKKQQWMYFIVRATVTITISLLNGRSSGTILNIRVICGCYNTHINTT